MSFFPSNSLKTHLTENSTRISASWNKINTNRLANFILLFFLILFLLIVCCNHYFFRTVAWDYGAYNFAFNDYAHLHNSNSTVYQDSNFKFIQDHISFTLMLFVPLYWLLSWLTGTYTLLIVQTFIIIFGAWAVYKLIELKSTNKLLPLLALLYYFLIIGRWTSFVSDCNLAIMASSMVPVFIYYFEKKKWYFALGAFIFILISREDMALWTFFIGLFLLLIHPKDKVARNLSIAIMAVSVAYFMFIFKTFIPLIETSDKKYTLFNYTALGSGPGEAIAFIFKHPIKTFLLLFQNQSGNVSFNNVKSEFYFVYLLSGGIIVFLRPRYLILFIPLLAKKMLNDDPIRWSIELYYSIEFVSILPVAVYLIIGAIRNSVLQNILAISVCLVTFIITCYEFETSHHKIPWWNNRKYAFYKPKMYQAEGNAARIHEYLNAIPKTASVSASCKLLPQLAFRKKIYYFPRVGDAEYIVVFRQNDAYPYSQFQFDVSMNKYLNSHEWEIIAEQDLFLILKKNNKINPASEEKPMNSTDSTLTIETIYTCDAETRSYDQKYFTSSNNKVLFECGVLQSNEKAHSGNYSIKLTEENPYGMTIVLQNVFKSNKIEISVWRYAPDGNGLIIASARNPAIYYNAEIEEMQSDQRGWKLYRKTIDVTKNLPNNELLIYLWNQGNTPVFFDDLKIVRKSFSILK
jgi:uncharacterized membrane protein